MSTNIDNTKSMVLKQAAPLRSVVSELSEAEVVKLDERDRGQGTHLYLEPFPVERYVPNVFRESLNRARTAS